MLLHVFVAIHAPRFLNADFPHRQTSPSPGRKPPSSTTSSLCIFILHNHCDIFKQFGFSTLHLSLLKSQMQTDNELIQRFDRFSRFKVQQSAAVMVRRWLFNMFSPLRVSSSWVFIEQLLQISFHQALRGKMKNKTNNRARSACSLSAGQPDESLYNHPFLHLTWPRPSNSYTGFFFFFKVLTLNFPLNCTSNTTLNSLKLNPNLRQQRNFGEPETRGQRLRTRWTPFPKRHIG